MQYKSFFGTLGGGEWRGVPHPFLLTRESNHLGPPVNSRRSFSLKLVLDVRWCGWRVVDTTSRRLCVGVRVDVLHSGDYGHLIRRTLGDRVVLAGLGLVFKQKSSNSAVRTFYN